MHGDLEAYSCAAQTPLAACAAGSALHALDVSTPLHIASYMFTTCACASCSCIVSGRFGQFKRWTRMSGLADEHNFRSGPGLSSQELAAEAGRA